MSELPTEAEYEERFKSRFSIDDEEFTAYVNEPSPSPPIFEKWISRSPRPQPSAIRRGFVSPDIPVGMTNNRTELTDLL